MIDLNSLGLDPQASAETNRQALQAGLDASASQSDPHVTCAAGTYDIAGEGLYGRNATIKGKLNLVPAAGTRFNLAKHAQIAPGIANGFLADQPYDVHVENLYAHGAGFDMSHVFASSYQGTERHRWSFKNVKVRNARYALKAMTGRTSVEIGDGCDWVVYITPFLHTYPTPGGAFDPSYVGGVDEIKACHLANVESGVYQGPGDPHPGNSWRDHCVYINPGIDVIYRGTFFDASLGFAHQSNGTTAAGYGSIRAYGVTVSNDCGSGFHGHPFYQALIEGGTFRSKQAPFRTVGGGFHIRNAGIYPATPDGPLAAIEDNDNVLYNGVLFEGCDIKLTPAYGGAFMQQHKPSSVPWVVRNSNLTQEYDVRDAQGNPIRPCTISNIKPNANGYHRYEGVGQIWLKQGALWGITAGSRVELDGFSVVRGQFTQSSNIPVGAYANVK